MAKEIPPYLYDAGIGRCWGWWNHQLLPIKKLTVALPEMQAYVLRRWLKKVASSHLIAKKHKKFRFGGRARRRRKDAGTLPVQWGTSAGAGVRVFMPSAEVERVLRFLQHDYVQLNV